MTARLAEVLFDQALSFKDLLLKGIDDREGWISRC